MVHHVAVYSHRYDYFSRLPDSISIGLYLFLMISLNGVFCQYNVTYVK